MFDTMITLFLNLHFEGQETTISKSRSPQFAEVEILNQNHDYYFCLLDSKKKLFAVWRGGLSYARDSSVYQLRDRQLKDVTKEVLSAHEIITQLGAYFVNDDQRDAFLAEPDNIALTYDKLYFYRDKLSNVWSVGLNAIHDQDEYSKEDVFRSMTDTSMVWNGDTTKFDMYNHHDFFNEGSYSNGLVTINQNILFMALTPGGLFAPYEFVPELDSERVMQYKIDLRTKADDPGTGQQAMITVSKLNKLPRAKITLETDTQSITTQTPLLLILNAEGTYHHFSLKTTKHKKAYEEIRRLVEENAPTSRLSEYLEELEGVY